MSHHGAFPSVMQHAAAPALAPISTSVSLEDDAHFPHSRDSTVVDSPGGHHSRGPSNASTMSGPFMYADDLESVNDAILSCYLEPESVQLDQIQPDQSEYRIPYKDLLRYIKQSGLAQEFRHQIRDIVKMVVKISDLLFPPTYLLNEEVKKKVLEFTTYINQYLFEVVKHLDKRIKKTHDAFCRLPSPAVTDTENLALSISKWSRILDSLHKPTGHEGYVFRELSSIYSSHVYDPFLQLHRTEPSHNIWQLESQLTPISSFLREAGMLADQADKSVRAIEEEFEMTMTHQPVGTPDNSDTGVLGESKRRHTPSKSAPEAINRPTKTKTLLRQRDNTI